MRNILRYAKEEHSVHGVKEIMKRLETYCKDRNSDVYSELPEPASASDIAAAEKEMKIKLPADYVAYLKMHNGSGDFGIYYDIASIKDVVSSHRILGELLEGGDFDGQDSEVQPGKGVKKVWWSEKWIPFAENGGGDHLVFDFDPAGGGTKGQVVEFVHDESWRTLKAGSFAEWLDKCVDEFIEENEKELEKANKAPETPPAKKSWWPW